MCIEAERLAIRGALRQVAAGYIADPTSCLRESDFQAAIWSMLRAAIPERTAIVGTELSTPRVHREMRIAPFGKADIVVYRADQPVVVPRGHGQFDFLEQARVSDLSAIVEVKAIPTMRIGARGTVPYLQQELAIVRDIVKLMKASKASPSGKLCTFLVFLEKADIERQQVPIRWADHRGLRPYEGDHRCGLLELIEVIDGRVASTYFDWREQPWDRWP